MNLTPDLQQYEALGHAALLTRADYGVLRLTGADRADFLQRMTTNNIGALKPGQSAVTVLTSSTARIVFVFTVLCREEDLLLLPGPHQAEALAKHLRGQIFFMDNVAVHDESQTFHRVRLAGQVAPSHIATWHAPAGELDEGGFITHAECMILHQTAFDLPGYELLIPAARGAAIESALVESGFVRVDDAAAYTARRVELGRPGFDTELIGDFSPLEAGLAWTCAENKGCYTGQEIIARQITYDKVTRTLVGLQFDESAALEDDPPIVVLAEGRNAGVVTSVAYSPRLETRVALAVIRRPHNEPGRTLSLAGESGESQATVQVCALPFAVQSHETAQ